MKKLVVFMLAALALLPMVAKKALDHDSFDQWRRLSVAKPSNDGKWAVYLALPQGSGDTNDYADGMLCFYNTSNGKRIEIPRGYKPAFTADSRWAVALIKPFFADTRKAKIDKKKDFDMPQDTLAVINLKNGNVEKIPNVISYKIGEKGGQWLAFQSCDTTYITPKALKDKKAGRPLILRNLDNNTEKHLKWVKEYNFDRGGNNLAVMIKKHSTDTVATDGIGIIMLPDTAFVMVDYDKKEYKLPVFDDNGSQIAYLATNDSVESGTKKMQLFRADVKGGKTIQAEEIYMTQFGPQAPNLQPPHSDDPELQEELMARWRQQMQEAANKGWYINQYSTPKFSQNGKKLVVGVAPYVAPNDTTIVSFEQPTLDIWRWDAPFTPPQENKNVEKIRKNTYSVVIDLASGNQNIMEKQLLEGVKPGDRWNSEWALLIDPSENYVSRQWTYTAPEELYIVNTLTGERRHVGSAPADQASISPDGNYIWWYSNPDRCYYVYDIATGATNNVTKDIPYPIWKEEQDIPMDRNEYGIAGWGEHDSALLIYDRHDIWSVDPKGKRKPICITNEDGRKQNRRYRYVRTVADPDKRFIDNGETILLSVFDYADKRNGLATLKYNDKATTPSVKVLDEYEYVMIRKAKDADVFSFCKDNFSVSPDMWVVNGYDFAKARKVSDINPQMKEYSWGTAQLVKWRAYDGKEVEGVLYVPEDLDPTKKYPMMTVFYETGSDGLYQHYDMQPSWSWINYPFYVSRGYVVFQPDIHYTPGVPGESCYNCVCSGVEYLCDQYEWIDRDRIGIDGQSWGGYQTAYLVTRTNMFACAGSGAPVANMTSAFGGIRWESGDSRQAQYEDGQSRIGRNLWEAPQLYIQNSPVFYADRVETPLLIMHNDADGAVPWYQGIEMFMALRRLQKPVWMLTYNSEAHNLKQRRNRKDITVRLQQFFDHYLKDAPMPKWMKEGIPATQKGQLLNYETEK